MDRTMFNMDNVIKPDPPFKRFLPESHALIISPGKCGSTLMVKLLTLLEVDTGYTKKAAMDKEYRSALEWPCRDEKADYYLSYRGNMPYLIKNNLLSIDLEEKIEKWNWYIDHIYFLNRHTESIVKRHFINRNPTERDINTRRETILNRKEELLGALSRLFIPVTIIEYPKFAEDAEYLYYKLDHIVNKYIIGLHKFMEVHKYIVDKNQLRGW